MADTTIKSYPTGSGEKLSSYIPGPNPYNIPAKKQYVFNETGNVMMSTTDFSNEQIQESVQKCFAEVQVFFAAMTKALELKAVGDWDKIEAQANTLWTGADTPAKREQAIQAIRELSIERSPFYHKIPVTPAGSALRSYQKEHNYSLYDYSSLKRVIDSSGCFIQVNEEDLNMNQFKGGANFSKDLLEAVLGLATGGGELAFAQAMVNSVGKAGFNLAYASDHKDTRVGNIIFVCEYLMGMPVISAIVITACSIENKQTFQFGPCFKESTTNMSLSIHKDTYTFVTPSYIKEFSGDIISGIEDPNFSQLVKIFEGYLR